LHGSLVGFEWLEHSNPLTDGQRIAQFIRLCTKDIGKDEIMPFDGKGRPGRLPVSIPSGSLFNRR